MKDPLLASTAHYCVLLRNLREPLNQSSAAKFLRVPQCKISHLERGNHKNMWGKRKLPHAAAFYLRQMAQEMQKDVAAGVGWQWRAKRLLLLVRVDWESLDTWSPDAVVDVLRHQLSLFFGVSYASVYEASSDINFELGLIPDHKVSPRLNAVGGKHD